MKISFPKYRPGELLTRKRGATGIISFVAIAFLLVCGSYLLGNKLWLLAIVMLGIAGILLYLRAAAAIFLEQNKVVEAPSAPIKEDLPRFTPQWDYRPTKSIRARAALDSSSTEKADGMGSDLAVTENAWSNGDSLECATPTFVDDLPGGEQLITNPLPQTTDPACTARAVDDVAVSRYD
jgi:hypothetical protein